MNAGIQWLAIMGIAGTVAAGDLIVEQVPAEVLAKTNTIRTVRATQVTTVAAVPAPDRWKKFEAEFGIRQPSPSLVKGSLQSAKYQLDTASVTLQEFVDTVRDRLQFDYGLTDPGSAAQRRGSTGNLFNDFTDALSRARLQSAIETKLSANAFFGVKLVLPLGD